MLIVNLSYETKKESVSFFLVEFSSKYFNSKLKLIHFIGDFEKGFKCHTMKFIKFWHGTLIGIQYEHCVVFCLKEWKQNKMTNFAIIIILQKSLQTFLSSCINYLIIVISSVSWHWT